MKKRIICIEVDTGSAQHQIEKLLHNLNNRHPGYVCFCNVHMLIEAYDDPLFAEIVNSATYAFPDGFPIARSFKWLYGITQDRIAGMDFLPTFLEICNQRRFKVAFVGSTDTILEQVRKKITMDLPGIELTNLISPPFGETWDNQKYIEILNDSGAQVIFVALGCPKQEKWMHANTHHIDGMMFGIGGALPTYAGAVRRAPRWMRNSGLEWLYRLHLEPKRMFGRYLYTNSKFVSLLIREFFR